VFRELRKHPRRFIIFILKTINNDNNKILDLYNNIDNIIYKHTRSVFKPVDEQIAAVNIADESAGSSISLLDPPLQSSSSLTNFSRTLNNFYFS